MRLRSAWASPHSSGSRERQCRNCMDMNMCVRVLSGPNGKIGGLLDLAESQQRERPRPMHAKQHRIKRAEVVCSVSCVYGARGIAGLALHKCDSVVSKRIIGTQTDGLIQLATGAVMLVPKPQRSTDRAMCCRVTRIGRQCLSSSLKCQSNLAFTLARLQQECVLKMRER